MLDELKIDDAQAGAIIDKAIELEVFTDDPPKSKKDRQETAHEIVTHAIDSWVSDGVTTDSDDEDVAAAGEQILEILELAGVEIEDDEVTYNDPPEADGEDDADGNESDGGDGEAPVDIEDIIEGYPELSAASKVKAIKALELDADEDEDYNTAVIIEEWENEQDKPASRVLDLLADILPAEDQDGEDDGDETGDEAGDGDADAEGEADPYTEKELNKLDKDDLREIWDEFELDEDDFPKRMSDKGKQRVVAAILEVQDGGEDEGDEDGEGEGEDQIEEPIEGYEDLKLSEIKEIIAEDERTIEEIDAIQEYEESREKPRNTLINALENRREELSEDGDDDGEDEPEEKPKTKAKGRRGKKDDPSEDVDDAVARDDEKDERKKRRTKKETEDADEGLVPKGLSKAFIDSKLREQKVREAGLAEPSDFEDEMPELPGDIDSVDHSDLSNIILALQNAFSTATWQASKAYIASDICEEIAEYLENKALIGSNESNDSKRRADAKTDPDVTAWRGEQKKAYHDYVSFRDLARTIEGKIKVISRVGGFKDDEQEGSNRTAAPKAKPAVGRKPAAKTEEKEEAPAKKPAGRTARSTTKAKTSATKTTTAKKPTGTAGKRTRRVRK